MNEQARAKQLSGPFAFHMDNNPAFLPPDLPIPGLPGKTILDFWRWAYSDVVSNRNRAVYAEYIVGLALGCIDTPRIEWDAVDLQYGGLKIEVKSSAYFQSWHQTKPSRISFVIKRAKAWDSTTGETNPDSRRNADIYIFCHCRAPNNTAAAMLDITSSSGDVEFDGHNIAWTIALCACKWQHVRGGHSPHNLVCTWCKLNTVRCSSAHRHDFCGASGVSYRESVRCVVGCQGDNLS